MNRPFHRMNEDVWMGGICAGLAYCLGWPTWAVRFAWAFAFFMLGFGGLIYLLLWLFVPKWPQDPADYATVTQTPSA